MNIDKMHEQVAYLFVDQVYETLRAILPEEIDVYINDVITEKTLSTFLTSINYSVNNSGIVNSPKMSNINLFKSLYRNARFKLSEESNDKLITYYNSDNGYYEISIPTIKNSNDVKSSLSDTGYCIDPMLYLSFALEYDEKSRGNATNCRIISEDEVENTLNDFCNGSSKEYPSLSAERDIFLTK